MGEDFSVLPDTDRWIWSGQLHKKVISARGIRWQSRHVIVTKDHLFFAKQGLNEMTRLGC